MAPLSPIFPCRRNNRCGNCRYYGKPSTPRYLWLHLFYKLTKVKPQLMRCSICENKFPYYHECECDKFQPRR